MSIQYILFVSTLENIAGLSIVFWVLLKVFIFDILFNKIYTIDFGLNYSIQFLPFRKKNFGLTYSCVYARTGMFY